jgi:predicted nucleotidyltransferase
VQDKNYILAMIKDSVGKTAPGSILILFGSYARGDHREDSDIDLLVLVDKEKVTRNDEIAITYPLFDIEFSTGTVIAPIVYSKRSWANHIVTPFYENVKREGVIL